MMPTLIAACTGASIQRATLHAPFLTMAMDAFSINTNNRRGMFLANIGHESEGLLYASELWGPTPTQDRYEGRADLGNTKEGDGKLFRGHGWLQITGRFNHAKARDSLRARFGARVPDFEREPYRLAEPEWAAYASADFWLTNKINDYADAGDFDGACDEVNRGRKTAPIGDSNGWAKRLALWKVAQGALT